METNPGDSLGQEVIIQEESVGPQGTPRHSWEPMAESVLGMKACLSGYYCLPAGLGATTLIKKADDLGMF